MTGIGVGLYFFVTWLSDRPNRPSMVWVHPILTPDEQKKVAAECRMRAEEAIGGGLSKNYGRTRYANDCLISEGCERVPDDD